MKEEDILNELKDQKVIKVEKFFKKIDNELVETGLIIITFACLELPERLLVGYVKISVRVYIPQPMRCSNCYQYRHTKKFCKNEKTCGICSNAYHTDAETGEQCSNPKSYLNCKLHNMSSYDHHIFDKSCPVYLKEKEIQAIITLEKKNRNSAITTYSQRNPNSKYSYAKISSTNVTSATPITGNNKPSTSTKIISTFDFPRPVVDYSELTITKKQDSSSIKANCAKRVTIIPRNTSKRTRSQLKKLSTTAKAKDTTIVLCDASSEEIMDLDCI